MQEGNVFTPVCHSVHRGWGCTPLGHTTSWTHPPNGHPHLTMVNKRAVRILPECILVFCYDYLCICGSKEGSQGRTPLGFFVFFFIFMQFSAKNLQPTLGVGAPSQENPASATALAYYYNNVKSYWCSLLPLTNLMNSSSLQKGKTQL